MKKRTLTKIILMLVAVLMIGTSAQAAVKMEKKSLKLEAGNSFVLRLKGNSTGEEVSWKTSKPKIVSIVSSSYNRVVIKALKAGTSKVSAEIGKQKLSCTVKVSKAKSFPKKLTLYAGDKYKYTFSKSAKWKLSNKNAKIKVAGNKKSATVTALKTGTVKLTATLGKKNNVCTITVIEKDGATLSDLREETKIVRSKLREAEKAKTTAEEKAKKEETDRITAESNAKTAEADKEKAEAAAKAAATAKDEAEKRASDAEAAKKEAEAKAAKAEAEAKEGKTTPTETISVTSISLSETSLLLDKGGMVFLEATCSPSNATDKTVEWKSSNNSVVTVNNGTVLGVGYGDAIVTASVGNVKSTCSVKVIRGGWLDGTELRLIGAQKMPIQMEDGEITSISMKKYHAENDNTVAGDYRYELEVKGKLASKTLIEDKGYVMYVYLLLTREDGSNSHRPWFLVARDAPLIVGNTQLDDGLSNRVITTDSQHNFIYTAYYSDITGDFDFMSINNFSLEDWGWN